VTVSSRSFFLCVATLCLFLFYHLAYLVDFMINIIVSLFVFIFYKNFCRFECRNVVCRNFYCCILEIFLPFSALVFTINFQNLLNIHCLQFLMNFNFIHKVSTVAWTSPFQDLIFLKFCYDICFRHFLPYLLYCNIFLSLQI
jgi:hypothetical protein